MHRVARELAHQECGWKHSEGHGVVALDYEGVRHVGLDKMCLLMEVRLSGSAKYTLSPSTLSQSVLRIGSHSVPFRGSAIVPTIFYFLSRALKR